MEGNNNSVGTNERMGNCVTKADLESATNYLSDLIINNSSALMATQAIIARDLTAIRQYRGYGGGKSRKSRTRKSRTRKSRKN